MTESEVPSADRTARHRVDSVEGLVAARQLRGLSQGEVSQRLKLRPRQLDRLEAGDWAALGGSTFVRGYLRAYGRLLDVDVDPLLHTLRVEPEGQTALHPQVRETPLPIEQSRFGLTGDRNRSARYGALVVAGVAAITVAYFSVQPDRAPIEAGTAHVDPPSTGVNPSPAPLPTSPAIEPSPPATTGQAAVPDPRPADSSAPSPSSESRQGEGPAQAPIPVPAIRVSVREDAWVEVRRADGTALHSGIVKPGVPLALNGRPPFSLTLGNAAAVSLEYEGREVDLKPVTLPTSNVARIKLP